MKPRDCWYCDGTVHFDADGIGDCDACPESYSAAEFIERENEKQQRGTEAADVKRKKYMEALFEDANRCLGIEKNTQPKGNVQVLRRNIDF